MNNNNSNKKKKKNSTIGAVAAVIIAFASVAESAGDDLPVVLAILFGIGVIVAVFALAAKAAKKAAKPGQTAGGFGARAVESVSRWSRDKGETPPVTAARPRTYVYDDRAYERNEQRDIQRRLAQLDDFLKNGIIEKEEYYILKARYERNGK